MEQKRGYLGENNTDRELLPFAKRENEVIFLEDNYEDELSWFRSKLSPESTIAIGIEQEIYVEQSIQFGSVMIENSFQYRNAKRKSQRS